MERVKIFIIVVISFVLSVFSYLALAQKDYFMDFVFGMALLYFSIIMMTLSLGSKDSNANNPKRYFDLVKFLFLGFLFLSIAIFPLVTTAHEESNLPLPILHLIFFVHMLVFISLLILTTVIFYLLSYLFENCSFENCLRKIKDWFRRIDK